MTLYPFEMQIAVDANNPDTVVQGGVVTIADPDTGSAITIVDPAGLPMANPIETSAQGFIPAFQATLPHVKWSDGIYAGFLSSYKGLLDEAVAAREAAEAALLAGVPSGGTTGQVLAKVTDMTGNYAWTDAEGGGGGALSVPNAISGMTGALGYGDNQLTTDDYALFTYTTAGNFRVTAGSGVGGTYSRIYNTVGDRGELNIESTSGLSMHALEGVFILGGEDYTVPNGELVLDPAGGEAALRYNDPIVSKDAVVSLYSGGVAITATTGIYLNATKFVRVPSCTTANRPTAAAAGVGGHVLDTTLGKPIWSNGTNWRDATGTVV